MHDAVANADKRDEEYAIRRKGELRSVYGRGKKSI
jgi:hypothetical protein